MSSEDQIKAGSAVVASIAHFNFISAWVATMIVTQAKVNKRAALLQKFMSIAVVRVETCFFLIFTHCSESYRS